MQLLNAPAEALPLAELLLQWLAPTLLLDAWNALMAGVMRALSRTRDTLFVMLLIHGAYCKSGEELDRLVKDTTAKKG